MTLLKNCKSENVSKENILTNDPVWTKCIFNGNPPLGFVSWNDWAENAYKSGVYTDVKVEAIDKI